MNYNATGVTVQSDVPYGFLLMEGGIWEDGLWEDGTWEDGTWEKGTWKNGTWEDGTWKNGWIYDPNKKGNFKNDWIWNFSGDYVLSPINPKEYFDKKIRVFVSNCNKKLNKKNMDI